MQLQPLRVALPLGIGDCHWACQKLRGLSEAHGGRPIHAYVNSSPHHASVGYLELVPFIEKAICSKDAPYDIWAEMAPSHRALAWSERGLAGGWRGFDYIVVANGHLERGDRIETFFSDIVTDYTYELNIPAAVREHVHDVWGRRRVLLYLSGFGPNAGFHQHTWAYTDWILVMRELNAMDITPLLVGAATEDDMSYGEQVKFLAKRDGRLWDDSIGETNIPEYCALIEDASVWIGLNSGGGIVSAMRGTPTIMLWSDSQYPKAADPNNRTVPLHTNMRTSWLAEDQLSTYRTISYGSPEANAEHVIKAFKEVAR